MAKKTRLTVFREIITDFSEKHMKPIKALCGQNAELLNVKSGGLYSDHCDLKG
jgi:hypothetical protein